MELFKKRTKLDRLKDKYCQLMKKSFKTSLTDRKKSDEAHREAKKIYDEIQYLSMQNADK